MYSNNEITKLVTTNAIQGTTTVTRMRIGPNEAQMLLENNYSDNRKIRESVVTKYANDMLNGLWRSESENMIVIGEDGKLYNGQHRLSAVCKTGLPQTFYVMTNADPSSYEVMDNGLARRTEDFIKNVPNKSKVAALAGTYYAMIYGGGTLQNCFGGRINRNISATRSDRLRIVQLHNELFQTYINNAYRMAKRVDGRYMTHIAIALMIIDQFHQGETLESFIQDFQNLCNSNPIIAMCKEMLLSNNARTDRVEQKTYNIGVLLTAYTLYREKNHERSERSLRYAFNNYTKSLTTYEQLLHENRKTIWAKPEPISA